MRDLALHEPDVELAGLEHRHVLGTALGVPRLDAEGGIERIDGLGDRLTVDGEAAARRGRAEDHDARLGLGGADRERAQRGGEAASPDADDHGANRTTGAPGVRATSPRRRPMADLAFDCSRSVRFLTAHGRISTVKRVWDAPPRLWCFMTCSEMRIACRWRTLSAVKRF